MATGNVALLLVRTHNAGGVFSSREKPSVRHALVRLTPFPSIALTLSRFIFVCLRRHRGSSTQERARVISAAPCDRWSETKRRVLEEAWRALPAEHQ